MKKTDTSTTNRADETMIERLTRLLSAEERRLEVETDAVARQTSARTVLLFCSELRKAEAAEHKKHSALTKATILDWFRNADPTEAARFHKELGQLFVKRSGLA